MALSLKVTLKDRIIEATSCIKNATLSGSYMQCARTLSVELLKPTGANGINCAPGAQLELYDNGKILFSGKAFTVNDDEMSPIAAVTAYDDGIYLKRNEEVIAVNDTPESITRQLAQKFGLKLGEIAVTGIKVRRNFLPSSGGANSLYNIIRTLYTLAGRTNGKKYIIRFEGEKLYVREKQIQAYSLLIKAGSNLINVRKTESAANTVTQVLVYDKNDRVIARKEAKELSAVYGLMQSVIVRSDTSGQSAEALAAEELADNGIERKIIVTMLGNSSLMAGDTVAFEQDGKRAVFWIDEDYHYWQNGKYTNKLLLNFKCMANEKLSGAEV